MAYQDGSRVALILPPGKIDSFNGKPQATARSGIHRRLRLAVKRKTDKLDQSQHGLVEIERAIQETNAQLQALIDTNVYVAEALLGQTAEVMLDVMQASWRIFVSDYVLTETERVLSDDLGFSCRLARLTRDRCRRLHAGRRN